MPGRRVPPGGARTGWLLLAVSAALCLASPAGAQSVYKWVDAQGRVHYGDPATAPRGADPVTLRRGAPAAASVVPDDCLEARGRLDSYLNAGDIVETDSLGVERALDDDRRAQLLARTELDVERACTAAP